MHIDSDRVRAERDWIHDRADRIVDIINAVRAELGSIFDTSVTPVTVETFLAEVDVVFADGDCAVNVAALVAILRTVDVPGDYPGFIVDEILGRELAATIAGTQPLRMLGEATYHYADIHVHGAGEDPAGLDDLEAALAAGFQERLPGWPWTESPSPFALEPAHDP